MPSAYCLPVRFFRPAGDRTNLLFYSEPGPDNVPQRLLCSSNRFQPEKDRGHSMVIFKGDERRQKAVGQAVKRRVNIVVI